MSAIKTRSQICFSLLTVFLVLVMQGSVPQNNISKTTDGSGMATHRQYLWSENSKKLTFNQFNFVQMKEINQKIEQEVGRALFQARLNAMAVQHICDSIWVAESMKKFRFATYQNKSLKRKALSLVGQEKTVRDLLFALKGETVEERIRNVVEEFQFGDYITPNTIFILTGVPKDSSEDEREDVSKQREVIESIYKIVRSESGFEILFKEEEDISTTIPIFSKEDEEKPFKSEIDFDISCSSRFLIESSHKGVKVNVEGVKVGKGFLKFGLPTLTIENDWGKLLGLRFYVAR